MEPLKLTVTGAGQLQGDVAPPSALIRLEPVEQGSSRDSVSAEVPWDASARVGFHGGSLNESKLLSGGISGVAGGCGGC